MKTSTSAGSNSISLCLQWLRRVIGLRRKPLRNKAGGLAWINAAIDEGAGTDALIGRVVTTVRANEDGFWVIDPPVLFRATGPVHTRKGFSAKGGTLLRVLGMHDASLTPLQDPGEEAQDESLRYLPPVPAHKETA